MAEGRQVVVETVRVTKVFRDFWMRMRVKALDRVDLQVNRGEILGLLGPNGSGKSTLVKILLGLLFPTEGRAAVFGRDPRNISVKDRIGYMPEESYLYRYLNAEETLDFYGRLFNLPRGERRHRIQLLLEMVGLQHQRRRPIVEYSKGMARRIGLAQALINDPDLVFLDEPTTGLDPIGTREIKDLIVELKRRGKTVFLCSHLLADVEDVCDRVAILYGGRIRRMGDIDELLKVRALTQITANQLKPETVDRVLEAIRDMEGSDQEVEVGSPRDRLESFFLRVVQEAREAQLDTAGTTAGTGAEAFFTGISREDKAEQILENLLLTADQKQKAKPEEEKEERVVLPAAEREDKQPKEAMIKQLVREEPAKSKGGKGEEEAAEKPAPEEQKAPDVLPASGPGEKQPTTEEVLSDLLKKDQRRKAESPDEPDSGGGQ